MAAETYVKTPSGHEAFRQRDAQMMSVRQRKAFLLFDGRRSLTEVLNDTAGLGVTADDVQDLVQKGLLASSGPAAAAPMPSVAPAAAPASPATTADIDPVECYRRAYPLATQITANLGLRGFRLNLQVEAAAGYDGLLALVPAIAKVAGENAVRPLREALGITR